MDTKQQHDAQALYAKAIACHQAGKTAEAIDLYARVAALFPDVATIHYNLGLACFESGRLAEAVNAYRRAAELCPEDADILYNLGLAYKKGGRFTEARDTYQKGLSLAPDDEEMRYNLGCCYKDAGEIDRAISVYEELLTLAPGHASTLNNLAYLRHRQGRYRQAEDLYKRLLELRPNHAAARYMLAALTGSTVVTPPPDYVRELFDQYSKTFEYHLVRELNYTTHLKLKQTFDGLTDRKPRYEHALDLGCGTGLAGAAFRPVCEKLSGVDLSGNMVAQAQEKGIYDQLHVGEINEYLLSSKQRYDLFVAADVLTYIGDLQPLFAAAWERGSKEALFCCSTETTATPDWTLRPTGRYAHHPGYIKKTAGRKGWQLLHCSAANIRKERNTWIKGNIFLLKKTADLRACA
ncbi:MAG: tetratricopeptide repeat protein [Deltaproteobacteria bacterium]|nr:tetratricopeptide repeat protein [Deltaproteobacteria bacterium]